MKYEIIKTDTVKSLDGRTLYRIKRIETGENGGYIEHESNLSHAGDAWVSGDARVFGDAQVSGNARVFGKAYYDADEEAAELLISERGSGPRAQAGEEGGRNP